jgi:UDP-N-acetylmuramoylalanine--D-glutamate ligase
VLHLNDLHVLILGLGDSGLAMARWCAGQGAASLRVWDSREQPPQLATLRAELPQAQFFSGVLDASSLGTTQLLLKSPGLSPLDARIAPVLSAAREAGIVSCGELELFARALADLKAQRGYAPKVLAITGTNGKTTTASLTAQLIERAGRRVALAGNIGPTLLDTLGSALAAQAVADAQAQAQAAAEGQSAEQPAHIDARSAVAPAGDRPAPGADITATAPTAPTEPAEAAPATQEAVPAAAPEDALASDDAAALPDDDTPLALAPPPPAEPIFEHLPQAWVLELSSFQLDDVRSFEPSAATVLNISQDHLDWHGDESAYVQAKSRIFGQTAVMVINRDDPLVEAMVPAPVVIKGVRGKPARSLGREVLRFGLDAPQHPGDFGLVHEGGMAWLVRALPLDETLKRRKGEAEELHLQRMMPVEALRIRGRHNASNALAALALATAADCALAPMLHGLREYRGEPHRVELIGQVGGIEAFDDSKGTNVGATVAALNGLGADKLSSKLVVILGGDGKGQDFSPLADPVAQHVRAVATIGRDAAAIEAALALTGVPLQRHASLEEAVRWCFAQAQGTDTVLLSPACASLDMFRDYRHRAEVFVAAVQALAQERGEMLL